MSRETVLIVLIPVCIVAILAVLVWSALRGAASSVDRAVNQPVTFDEDARFSPSTEQAIAQALSVSGQPASWAGTLRRKDGA